MSDDDVVKVYARLSHEKRFASKAVSSLLVIVNVKSVGQFATVSDEETFESRNVWMLSGSPIT